MTHSGEVQAVWRRLRFPPWQALKMTTVDCFDVNSILLGDKLVRRVLEREHSPWIAELAAELDTNDLGATFMNHARHFILFLYDEVAEIIAHDCRLLDIASPESG